MIKYKLVCKDCNILFDSWFASSKEYEKLKKKNFLSCHNCNSFKVEKTIMAPKVINNSKVNIDKKEINFKDISKKIKEYQKFIKKNLNMLEKILLMKQDPFITEKKQKTKVFLEQHQRMTLPNLRKRELMPK